jgi:hypothetical protein
MAALPLAVLTDAKVEATAVYQAAGVTILWSDRPAERESGSDDVTWSEPPGDVRVIVVGGTAERRFISDGRFGETILGYATTKAGCFCGRHAYIFSDRTLAVGYRRGNPTSLLGRIIAHEIGHLLLSSNSHAGSGIMRATLDTEPSFQPRFTEAQVKALRRGIARLETTPEQKAAGR